jgi:apolipoprotein N-acyltransferase
MIRAGVGVERNTRSVTAKMNSVSWRHVGLALCSGLLLVAAFPPLDVGVLAWVAMVPLLLAIDGLPPFEAFRLGMLSGFVAFLGIISWIQVFGIPVWILLAAYLALYVGLFCGVYRWVADDRSPVVRLWLVPLLWVSVEFLRSSGPMGFPWATLGSSQHGLLPVIQIASLAGVFGISGIVALGNAVVANLGWRRVLPVLVPALLIVAVLGWGTVHARTYAPGSLVAVAIQPNVPQREKFTLETAPRNMAALERLVNAASQYRPELIVFPESAVPINLFGPGGALGRVGQWAQAARATVLASSLENRTSNIAVTVAPSGQALSRYDKVHLVAFGEAGIQPGTSHDPLTIPGGSIGVAICFESIFPDVARAVVRNGAETLAIITNDSWFDGTSGPAQHAAHAALRAVEVGRWVIRAANTGSSMVIDPAGRIVASTAQQQQTLLVGRLAPSHTLTFYTRWGDLFAWMAVGALIILAAPRWLGLLRSEWHEVAFHQILVAVALPLIAVGTLLLAGWAEWGWPILLLGFLGIMSYLQRPKMWGWEFRSKPIVRSLLAGLVVVVGLWALLAVSYRAQGISIVWPPSSAWLWMALRQIGIAVVAESWLRGLAFVSFTQWKGWRTAVLGTTLLGMVLQIGLPAEAFVWALVTGLTFGLIRMWTGSMTGLIMPHALGNLLLGLIVLVR